MNERISRRTLLKTGVAATASAGLAGAGPRPSLQASAQDAASVVDPIVSTDGGEPEPTMAIAKSWWTENKGKFTPIGWKDHPSYFGVFHNGAIHHLPNMMIGFNDPHDHQVGGVTMGDYGSVEQGWADTDAPVLWTRWFPYTFSTKPQEGAQILQEIFVHLPGALDVETGKEPLFAWVRVSINELCDGFVLKDRFQLRVKIGGAHGATIYKEILTPDRDQYDPAEGYRLLGPEGKVHLAIAPGQDCTVEFLPSDPENNLTSQLNILIKMEKGAHVDLLIPAKLEGAPYMDNTVVDREMTMGREKALEETNAYWAKKPETAARFDVPEEEVNRIIGVHLKMAEIVAKYRDDEPYGGYKYIHSGSLAYNTQVGPITTDSLTFGFLLNLMGYHSVAEKYLLGFKACQGKYLPVGDHFEPHPGYLGEPRTAISFSWFSQHGALLWVIADHALLWGKPEIMEEWTPVIVKACDWIQYALGMEVPEDAYPGIMPPGLGSDIGVITQDVWNDAFTYKGLTSALRFLRAIDHPRTGEFTEMAKNYRENYQKAVRDKTSKRVSWTHTDGKERRLVPTSLMGDHGTDGLQAAFAIDIGSLALVWGGLLDADDELMETMRLYYREGPPKQLSLFDQQAFALNCLFHETSSCEPHWSWVMWHSWQLGDRQRYLESMYSIWMSSLSQQTYTVHELRGGGSGRTPYCPSNALARFAVIDDVIVEDELHLLRMVPLAWLTSDREAIFESMPTFFGPIDLRVQLSEAKNGLEVSFNPHFRRSPNRVVLHIPPVEGLKTVRLNGKPLGWKPGQTTFVLSEGESKGQGTESRDG